MRTNAAVPGDDRCSNMSLLQGEYCTRNILKLGGKNSCQIQGQEILMTGKHFNLPLSSFKVVTVSVSATVCVRLFQLSVKAI